MVSVVCAWRENERQTARASYGRDEDEKRAGASIDSRETRRDVESRIVETRSGRIGRRRRATTTVATTASAETHRGLAKERGGGRT